MTALFALEIPPVALQAGNPILREYPVELCVLVGGHDVIVLSFQQFGKIGVGLACFTFIIVFDGAKLQRPAFTLCYPWMVKAVEHVPEPIFLS